MGWIKKLFGLEKKEQGKEELYEEQVVVPVIDEESLKECFFCKQKILPEEHWSKQQGKWFHKKCYKQIRRLGMNG